MKFWCFAVFLIVISPYPFQPTHFQDKRKPQRRGSQLKPIGKKVSPATDDGTGIPNIATRRASKLSIIQESLEDIMSITSSKHRKQSEQLKTLDETNTSSEALGPRLSGGDPAHNTSGNSVVEEQPAATSPMAIEVPPPPKEDEEDEIILDALGKSEDKVGE